MIGYLSGLFLFLFAINHAIDYSFWEGMGIAMGLGIMMSCSDSMK